MLDAGRGLDPRDDLPFGQRVELRQRDPFEQRGQGFELGRVGQRLGRGEERLGRFIGVGQRFRGLEGYASGHVESRLAFAAWIAARISERGQRLRWPIFSGFGIVPSATRRHSDGRLMLK
jgi:hypothetical protein